MFRAPQLHLAICFLAVCASAWDIRAPAGSGRHLKQLSFTVPSSAIPGLLGLVSPTTPIPAPGPGIAIAPALNSSTGAGLQAAAGSAPAKAPAPSNSTVINANEASARSAIPARSTQPPARASPPPQPSPNPPPGGGIMGMLPELENNLMQRVKDNEKDTSNVHGLNLTVALATSPAPAPDKFHVSQQLGNATALQEGPNVSVDVHVDPVITVNGGVHISANGTQAMPLLGNLLPASAPPPPAVLLGSPDDTGDGPLPVLPPVPPGGNEAYNTAAAPEICGDGTLPYVACAPAASNAAAPALQPYTQNLLTQDNSDSPPKGSRALNGAPSGTQGPAGLLPFSLNDTSQDSKQIMAAVAGAAQAIRDSHDPAGKAPSSGWPAESAAALPITSGQATPGYSGDYQQQQYGALNPQAGGIWPGPWEASNNWALILTATSSTITCIAVIFLVLLFLVFRMGGCRASRGSEGPLRQKGSRDSAFKGSAVSLASQDSPRRRVQSSRQGRDRRLRMWRFLERSTPSIAPTNSAAPAADVEKGNALSIPAKGSVGTDNCPARGSNTSQDALLAPSGRHAGIGPPAGLPSGLPYGLPASLPRGPTSGAAAPSGPMPLPSPFASRQEQAAGSSPGATGSGGIAPSPFACTKVQAPFSGPSPSAASGHQSSRSSGFVSCL